ncbi:MAG: hypothetical protein KIS92_21760 [Planctomycetota bacterium]|nr:hypothetical protein [Planctomycetota bacterium]
MLLRRVTGWALVAAAGLAGYAHAGTPRPELPPSEVDGKSDDEALDGGLFFELYLRKSQKGAMKFDKKTGEQIPDPTKVSICQACNQPMYLHADPQFKCVPQGPLIPGTTRHAQPLEIREVQAACPSCKATFIAAYQANQNANAGMDRDFCMHSVGQDVVVASSVWMCPQCGYAGLADKLLRNGQVNALWGKELDGSDLRPSTLKLVNEVLKPYTFDRMIDISGLRKDVVLSNTKEGEDYRRFNEYIRQTQIPDWLKYKNAIFLMEKGELKLPHTLRARMYLEGAWACRREVCSEIGISGLEPSFQKLMGKSIRLMQKYIIAECLNIRQRRREGFVDPTNQTDPYVLAEACANIIKYGEEIVQEQQKKIAQGQPAGDQARFQVGDIFVLRLRQAGFLDRCGKINEALETLEKTRAVIPILDEVKEVMEANKIEDKRALKTILNAIELNLQMLHRTVEDRASCLKLEREYLFRAAEHLMQSLYFNENAASRDVATTVYWAGELYRRDAHELDVAKACFQASQQLIKGLDLDAKRRKLDELTAKRKDPTKSEPAEDALRNEIVRMDTLSAWCEENALLAEQALKAKAAEQAKAGLKPENKPLRENVAKAIDEILKRAGISAKALAANPGPVEGTRTPEAKTEGKTGDAPEAKVDEPKTAHTRPAAAGAIKTREELYKVYYEAIGKFVAAKKANPESLSELVGGGFLSQENSCLDENGVLVDPETGTKLLYQKGVKFGDKILPYIYPRAKDPNQKKLYADGHVAE